MNVIIGTLSKSSTLGTQIINTYILRESKTLKETPESYVADKVYLDISLTIAKTSSEGLAISQLIAGKCTKDAIHRYLINLVILNTLPTQLYDAMNKALVESYNQGWTDRAKCDATTKEGV